MEKLFFPIKENNLWGFIDFDGKTVISPQYNKVSDVFEDVFFAQLPTFESGLRNINGDWLIEPRKLLSFNNFCSGYAIISDHKMQGITDIKGNITDLSSYNLRFITDELICAQKNDKFGYIDFKGNIVIDFKYDSALFFNDGLAQVSLPGNNFWSFINKNGEIVISGNILRCGRFSEGKLSVQIDGKYSFIDISGKTVLPGVFEYAGDFFDGLAPVEINNMYGYINHEGEFVIKPKYSYASNFKNGTAVVFDKNIRYGFINTQGQYIIAPQFVEAEQFENGLAKVLYKKQTVSGFEKNPYGFTNDDIRNNPISAALANQSYTKSFGINDGYFYYLKLSGEFVYPQTIAEEFVSVEEYNEKNAEIISSDIEEPNITLDKIVENQTDISKRDKAVRSLFAEFVTPFKDSVYLVSTAYPWVGLILGFLFGNIIIPHNTGSLYPESLNFFVFPLSLFTALLGFAAGNNFRGKVMEAGSIKHIFSTQNIITASIIFIVSYSFHSGIPYNLGSFAIISTKIISVVVFSLLGLWIAQILNFMLLDVDKKSKKNILKLMIFYLSASVLFTILFVFVRESSMHPSALILLYCIVGSVISFSVLFLSNIADSKLSTPYTFWPLFSNTRFRQTAKDFFTFSTEEIEKFSFRSKFNLEKKLESFIINRSATGFFALYFMSIIIGLLPWAIVEIFTGYGVF